MIMQATAATWLPGLADAGPFSTATAQRLGVSADVLADLARAGRLVRVTHGWYDVPRAASPVEAHARLVEALVRRYAGRAVASHHSALIRAGLPVWALPLDVAHLARPGPGCTRRARDHVVHRRPPGPFRAEDDAVPLACALAQVAARYGPRAVVVPGDAALARALIGPADLAEVLAAWEGRPGWHIVRSALGGLDGRSESPGESLLRFDLRALGYAVTPQVEVAARGRRYRPDLVVDGTRVAVEFDGRGKYADPEAFAAEKRREEDLRDLGWVFVRFMWGDLGRLAEMDRRMRAATGRQ